MVYEILCGASLFLKIDMTFPQICFPISANFLFSFPNIFNIKNLLHPLSPLVYGSMVLINLNPVAGNIILLWEFYKYIFGVYLRQTLNFSISSFWRVLLSSDHRVSVCCTFILFE